MTLRVSRNESRFSETGSRSFVTSSRVFSSSVLELRSFRSRIFLKLSPRSPSATTARKPRLWSKVAQRTRARPVVQQVLGRQHDHRLAVWRQGRSAAARGSTARACSGRPPRSSRRRPRARARGGACTAPTRARPPDPPRARKTKTRHPASRAPPAPCAASRVRRDAHREEKRRNRASFLTRHSSLVSRARRRRSSRRLRRRRSSRRSSRSSPPTTERPLRRRARGRRKTRRRISPYQSPRRRLPPRLPAPEPRRGGQALEGKKSRSRFLLFGGFRLSVFVASFVSSSPPPASRAWKVRRASSTSRGARPGVESGSSFAAASHRSGRALLWSGPWPSCPCGSRSTSPEALPPLRLRRRDELVDDALRVVGEVAELRLPQDERLVAGVHAVPISNPNTACSLSGEFAATKRSWRPSPRLSSGFTPRLVREQYRTAWRWLNVPRSTSCPEGARDSAAARRPSVTRAYRTREARRRPSPRRASCPEKARGCAPPPRASPRPARARKPSRAAASSRRTCGCGTKSGGNSVFFGSAISRASSAARSRLGSGASSSSSSSSSSFLRFFSAYESSVVFSSGSSVTAIPSARSSGRGTPVVAAGVAGPGGPRPGPGRAAGPPPGFGVGDEARRRR